MKIKRYHLKITLQQVQLHLILYEKPKKTVADPEAVWGVCLNPPPSPILISHENEIIWS